MDLTLSPSEEAFRDELRSWLEAQPPRRAAGGRGRGLRVPPALAAQAARGRLGGPVVAEGVRRPRRDADRAGDLLRGDGAREGAARRRTCSGLVMGGPVVITHGTEEQKQRYLEPILSAEEIWCQGFSEPEAGSDLASLKTRAVKRNGGWVVSGQKVWTTLAHEAKWCMLVARTDPDAPKHQGLTYFLMDMEQDGVEVKPLVQITGEAEFNEIFMDEAYIPDENIVGGVGSGWAVAITTLMNERAGLAFAAQAALQIAHARGDRARQLTSRNGGLASEDPVVRDRLAQLFIESEIFRVTNYRGLTKIMKNGVPGPEGSLGKWQWAEVNQHLMELAMEIEGPVLAVRRRLGVLARRRLAVPVPAHARELDRGRHDRHPQEHRRRAGARPAQACGKRRGPTMNFDLTDEQQMLQAAAREFLAARLKSEKIRALAESDDAFSEDLWREMSDLNWPGLMVSEAVRRPGARHGRAGRADGAARLRARAGPDPLQHAGRDRARDGRHRRAEGALPRAARRRREARDARALGRRRRVGAGRHHARARACQRRLRAERREAVRARRRDGRLLHRGRDGRPPVHRRARRRGRDDHAHADDRRDPQAVRGQARRRQGRRGRRVRRRRCDGRRARCAPTSRSRPSSPGIAQRAMEMAVDYAKERKQFGRPIGAYQAVSHRCAQMLLETEGARSAAYYAAWAADNEPETAPLAASMAKAYASDAGTRVTGASLQVHGGIGFTWEHDLHLFLKRASADAVMFGDARWHRERVAQLVIDQSAAPIAAEPSPPRSREVTGLRRGARRRTASAPRGAGGRR